MIVSRWDVFQDQVPCTAKPICPEGGVTAHLIGMRLRNMVDAAMLSVGNIPDAAADRFVRHLGLTQTHLIKIWLLRGLALFLAKPSALIFNEHKGPVFVRTHSRAISDT